MTNAKKPFLIRSGIPALDAMFRPPGAVEDPKSYSEDDLGIALTDVGDASSISIAGPDGTGKSALAMHFVSRYAADCDQFCRAYGLRDPLMFYVSTDLSYDMAKVMWENFSLDTPHSRKVPFHYAVRCAEHHPLKCSCRRWSWLGGAPDETYRIQPQQVRPHELKALTEYLSQFTKPAARQDENRQVAFIDLASAAAGDDWGFLERLLAAMPEPEKQSPRHLLVLDAMEGMETFGGVFDAYGQPTSRRGRVAKLMRVAGSKCHLLFVIEESADGLRLPEQFVANVVLRLRATEDHGYSRRTIEIEKSRGQSHVRGRHPYVIRDGKGSTTGEQVNFDDPPIRRLGDRDWQSYIDVFPSLHSISRRIMENRGPGRYQPSARCAGFGIRELDHMLSRASICESADGAYDGQDERGLPCGLVSALIGDANTQKSYLAFAYLGNVFHELIWRLVCGEEPTKPSKSAPQRVDKFFRDCVAAVNDRRGPDRLSSDELEEWINKIAAAGNGRAGAVVLVTSKDENNRTLVDRFIRQLRDQAEAGARRERRAIETLWTEAFEVALRGYLESRTVCRRLEIHDTPSPVLFHAIRRSIEAAQQIIEFDYADVCECPRLEEDAAKRSSNGWRIRVVIDDFNAITRTYGRIHDDHLFLPFLLHHLRREGLSSLIVETQTGAHGSPALPITEDVQSGDLRALSDHRLYTWHVPQFFGDHRIAIAAIPPMVKQDVKSPVLVRELEWQQSNSIATPRVHPRFELYAGLDTNAPKLVPLRVYLYAETEAWHAYIDRLDHSWHRVFEPPPAVLDQGRRTVVVPEKLEHYELMRDVCDLHAGTNLDHSLIVQVDEFWQHRHAFRRQVDYLMNSGTTIGDERVESERPEDGPPRRDWFDDVGNALPSVDEMKKGRQLSSDGSREDNGFPRLDRIPFVWDFGFLACKEQLWTEATKAGSPLKRDETTKKKLRKIRKVWKCLTTGRGCGWGDLLEAASFVARWESARQSRPIPAFDLAMGAPETFSCLVFEIWLSEIYLDLRKRNLGAEEVFVNRVKTRDWRADRSHYTLADLVAEYKDPLYRTWLLLVEALDLASFKSREEGFGFAFGRKADSSAVIVRHWYKSAALAEDEEDEAGSIRFARLPGMFSVRGDWFLATLRGSRSDRLADLALDLLSTPGANVDRLIRGLGLPTRSLQIDAKEISSRLRGWHFGEKDHGTLTYANIRALGANGSNLHWFWRSNLKDYYAASPIWERWLFRMMRRWQKTREFFASEWQDGFSLYQRFQPGKPAPEDITILPSYTTFMDMCDTLVKELKRLDAKS